MDNKTARPSGSDLVRLVQALRGIQICRGQRPWRYLDLSMAQLKAVMLRSRDLADGLNIAPSAATPLVDRLVEQRLAKREDDPSDRRIVWIHPTAKAQQICDELLEMNEEVLAEVIKEIPASERKAANHCISLLADAAARVLEKDKQS